MWKTVDPYKSDSLSYIKMDGREPPLLIPADILFAFDSAKLKPEAESVLNAAVKIINARPKGKIVSIEGHTDAEGTSTYNLNLSLERALAVKHWLVGHHIPDAPSFLVMGLGETKPVAMNRNADGRITLRAARKTVESRSAFAEAAMSVCPRAKIPSGFGAQ